MTSLAELLSQALEYAEFRTDPGTSYSAKAWNEALTDADGSVSETQDLLEASIEVGDVWIDQVANRLRCKLREYINDDVDFIGHSLAADHRTTDVDTETMTRALTSFTGRSTTHVSGSHLYEVRSNSPVRSFARGLIRAAVILGPDRAAELIGHWADGEPRPLKVRVLLTGDLQIDQLLDIGEGCASTSCRCRPIHCRFRYRCPEEITRSTPFSVNRFWNWTCPLVPCSSLLLLGTSRSLHCRPARHWATFRLTRSCSDCPWSAIDGFV